MTTRTEHANQITLITVDDGNGVHVPAMMTRDYAIDADGIWTWTGLWATDRNPMAAPMFPGMMFQWNLLDGDGNQTYVVVKVNRMTVKLQAVVDGIAEGPVKTIRIDR